MNFLAYKTFIFNNLNLDVLNSKSSVQRPQIWVLFQDVLLFYCMLYTCCPGGWTAAIARHVSFAQITCYIYRSVGCVAYIVTIK